MTGTEFSGWDAGSPQLFHDKVWVVATDDDTDLEVWTDVVALALACGATVVPAAASDEHDVAVARISHLPHLLAAVLAAVGADGGELALALAAGAFTDGTRVAGTRPELTAAMCEGNRAALLAALDDALGRLGAARGSLASTGGLARHAQRGPPGAAGTRSEPVRGAARRQGRPGGPARPGQPSGPGQQGRSADLTGRRRRCRADALIGVRGRSRGKRPQTRRARPGYSMTSPLSSTVSSTLASPRSKASTLPFSSTETVR